MRSRESVGRYTALVDTSSIVAHDLCAQLHVLQFCVEELSCFVSPEGRVYLEKMGNSTHYLSNLLNTFRRQLKIQVNDKDPTPLIDIHRASLELIKNHFFVLIEKIEFQECPSTKNCMVKAHGRRFMHILFALYSQYIESMRDRFGDDLKKVNFKIGCKQLNPRFASVLVEFGDHSFTEKEFWHGINDTHAEKGKIRKFLGVNLIKEMLKEDKNSLIFKGLDEGAVVSFTLPLVCESN